MSDQVTAIVMLAMLLSFPILLALTLHWIDRND